MGRDPLSIWYRETTRCERARYGLGAGCLVSGGFIGFILLLSLFGPQAGRQISLNEMLGFGAGLLCITAPLFFMVATGTYVQLTYAGMWRRLVARWQAKNNDAENKPGPLT